MDQLNHHDYYVSRAESARKLAQRAISPVIAAIHVEMAQRYEMNAAQTSARLVYAGGEDQAA